MSETFRDTRGNRFTLWGDVHEALSVFASTYGVGSPGKGWIYRGQSNAEWGLIPSLYRHPADARTVNARRTHTQRFIEDLRRLASEFSLPVLSPIEYQAIAQHYGLYTSLMDFTYDPDIAAFFATHGAGDAKVGVIFAVPQKEYIELRNPFSAMGMTEEQSDELLGNEALPPLRLVTLPPQVRRVHAQQGLFIERSDAFLGAGPDEDSFLTTYRDRFYFVQRPRLEYTGGRPKHEHVLPSADSVGLGLANVILDEFKRSSPHLLERTRVCSEDHLFPSDDVLGTFAAEWKKAHPL